MKLTTNFYEYEMLVSADHPELVEELRAQYPHSNNIACAKLLAEAILQPVRNKFGKVVVLSWLRPEKLNEAVKGAKDSDHIGGHAADIVCEFGDMEKVYNWIVDNNHAYRQCIYYKKSNFIHLSMNVPSKMYKHEFWIV